MRFRFSIHCLMCAAVLSVAPTYLQSAEMDHADLSVYHDTDGKPQPIKTPADWAKRRSQILAGMQAAMGPLPKRSDLPFDLKVLAREKGNGFERQTISILAEGKDRITAYLYLPLSRAKHERRPAMLALHPTGTQGKGIVAGEGPRPNREYGLELAKRGYVVICPDYPSFGDASGYDFNNDDYQSGTMKGIFNHMRCVDFLISRDEVDPNRIGVIGHSLGGHNALFAAAFDSRLKVIVSSCGWTPFHDYYAGKIAGWTSDRYMPLLKTKYNLDPDQVPFDFYEVVAAMAPRLFFSNSPLEDSNFDYRGVKKTEPKAQAIYKLLGAEKNLVIKYPNCQHDFPTPTRKEAYAFIDRGLNYSPVEGKDFAAELPRIPAHSPKEALNTFQTLDGFRIDQTASEPLVTDPVAMAFDEDGRLFVVEMRGYSEQEKDLLGQIRVLEDEDGDGHFDKSQVLADKLSWPTAILCFNGGVFVGAAPHLYYLKDTTGDGKADVRKIVFTGFGKSNVQGLMNSFRWGLDNRIHGATSSSGGSITRPDNPKTAAVNLRGRDFSFDPKTFDIRPESGGAQHGMDFDEWGRKFVCSNSDHIQAVMIEERYLARNPYLAVPRVRMSIAQDGPQAEVYRQSPVEPWRLVRTRLRAAGLVRGPVEGGGRAAGYFTGSTGVTIYKGNAWPHKYQGQAIVGDVGSNIIHRKTVEWNGLTPTAKRIDEKSEFITSTDIWFRPVQFANAPDGTLHILDMYREVIEHPKSLPPEIKKHLDLTSGRDRGRLYRVLPPNFQQPKLKKLSRLNTSDLLIHVEHSNTWHRETAARLLYERQDQSSESPLRQIVKLSPFAFGRMHALYALAGQDALEEPELLVALNDKDPQVRKHAVRLAEQHGLQFPAVIKQVLEMVNDKDIAVRYQLAFSLGEIKSPQTASALAAIIQQDPANPWMKIAVLSSLTNHAGPVFSELAISKFSNDKSGAVFLTELATLIGRSGRQDDVAHVLKSLSNLPSASQNNVVQGLVAGLSKSGSNLKGTISKNSKAGELIDNLIKSSRQKASDSKAPAAARAEAVRTLGISDFASEQPLLVKLLDYRQPKVVQSAVVSALGQFDDPQVAPVLLEPWSRYSPDLRAQALSVLITRPSWTLALLEAATSEQIPSTHLSLPQLTLLVESRDAKVKSLAAKLLVARKVGRRSDVVKLYQSALKLAGNADTGREIFKKNCSACHKVENFGREIGPNLAAMKNRGAESILLNVLDPNRELNPEFTQYIIATTQGQVFTGLIASETATSITLRQGENKPDRVVLRVDIEQLKNSGRSLMPEGLEKTIKQQDMADLIAYLTSLKAP